MADIDIIQVGLILAHRHYSINSGEKQIKLDWRNKKRLNDIETFFLFLNASI